MANVESEDAAMVTTTTRSSVQDYGKAAGEAAGEALEGVKSVREFAAAMAGEAKAAAGPVIDTVRERAQQFGEQAQQLGSQAQDMAGNAYEQGRSAVRAVNRQIEEQPLFTALAAFAIGYGISYLLHSQR